MATGSLIYSMYSYHFLKRGYCMCKNNILNWNAKLCGIKERQLSLSYETSLRISSDTSSFNLFAKMEEPLRTKSYYTRNEEYQEIGLSNAIILWNNILHKNLYARKFNTPSNKIKVEEFKYTISNLRITSPEANESTNLLLKWIKVYSFN